MTSPLLIKSYCTACAQDDEDDEEGDADFDEDDDDEDDDDEIDDRAVQQMLKVEYGDGNYSFGGAAKYVNNQYANCQVIKGNNGTGEGTTCAV